MTISLRPLRAALVLSVVFGVAAPVAMRSAAAATSEGAKDAVVVAIIDSGISPYHLDYTAKDMPQAKNKLKSDDLPLGTSPHKWLPGFPKPSSFGSYNELNLSLPKSEDDRPAALHTKDAAKWAKVKPSTADALNYYWIPNSKIIGAFSFGPTDPVDSALYTVGGVREIPFVAGPYVPIYGTGTGEHGMGTASVSAGNIYGTCPECLIVFIQHTDDVNSTRALEWANRQPWIDVVSNSYGCHTAGSAVTRDNVCGNSNTTLQKESTERGQTTFFSAGNGYENAFVTPNQTLLSSQKGPDWIVTVGGTSPGSHSYTGAGKPVDVAGIGENYPSSYGASTAAGGGRFSGTSNATPTVAGIYARGLYLARRLMAGPSRVQAGGVISRGRAKCGFARRNCEIGDGRLTGTELRTRLLHGAVPVSKGFTPGGLSNQPWIADEQRASEGHGTYFARLKQDDAQWLTEFNRFFYPLVGRAPALSRPAEEREWFLVESWCKQHIWGAWKGGYYVEGVTKLPDPDPESHPTRTALQVGCNALVAPPKRPGF